MAKKHAYHAAPQPGPGDPVYDAFAGAPEQEPPADSAAYLDRGQPAPTQPLLGRYEELLALVEAHHEAHPHGEHQIQAAALRKCIASVKRHAIATGELK